MVLDYSLARDKVHIPDPYSDLRRRFLERIVKTSTKDSQNINIAALA